MDNLERVFRHLVATITAQFPQYLNQPFTVGQLYQDILPYRHHRRSLGLDTNQDYELVLLQLLAGVRGFLVVDDAMRDALQKELAQPTPDAGAFKRFAEAQVSLAPQPEAPARPAAPAPAAAPAATKTPARASTASGHAAPTPAASRPSIRAIVPEAGSKCRACGQQLPGGRQISFCPHCGESLTTIDCPACGAELEVGWRFCPACGRPAKTDGPPAKGAS